MSYQELKPITDPNDYKAGTERPQNL